LVHPIEQATVEILKGMGLNFTPYLAPPPQMVEEVEEEEVDDEV